MPHVVQQALADLRRKKRWEEDHYVSLDPTELMARPHGLPDLIRDRLDWLLGPHSLLHRKEKEVLILVLIDPLKFLYPDGQLRQAAIGAELGVDQKTIFTRWNRIRKKIAALNPRTRSQGGPLL